MGGRRTLGPPKVRRRQAARQVPASIFGDVVAHLDRFVQPAPDAWVFTGPRGAPLGESYLSAHFRKAMAAGPGAPPGLGVHDRATTPPL